MRRICVEQEAKPTHTTNIQKYLKDLSEKYKAAKGIVPKTNDILKELKFESNATFATALGINTSDCVNYCIK